LPCRGDVCAGLGVGPPPLPLKGITVQQLAAAMQQLLNQPSYSQAAQAVCEGLQQEDGLEAALLSVQRTLSGSQVSDR
jgi:UDP:flavonoid glycosyltransferase YjiC (YdhE family)